MTQSQTPVTTRDFEQFIARAENADRRFELIQGEIVAKAMPTEEHGIIAGNAITELNIFLRQHRLGRAAVEARHRPPGDEHNDWMPDVSYVTGFDRPVTQRGVADFMPDLAVEVQSPDDSPKAMLDRAQFYLANGVKMVWLVYPRQRIVEILTPDARDLLTLDDTIDGGAVLPGFSVPVANLFIGV